MLVESRTHWLSSNARLLGLAFGLSVVLFLAPPSLRVFALPAASLPDPAALALVPGGNDDDDDDDAQKSDAKKGSSAAKPGSDKKANGPANPAKDSSAKQGPSTTDGEGEDEDSAKSRKPPKKILSVDDQYVRDNLEKYLSPSKIEFLPDGRVKLVFEFGEHKEDHEGIFTPRVSKDTKSKFRWSLRSEWAWGYGWTGTRNKDGEYEYLWEGLRIANDGSAHLNCWFTDDVEAEISYVQAVSSSPKQTVAVVFTNTSGNSVGSNFGTQCATFSNGALSKRQGSIETIPTDRGFKLKLLVRDGKFEAHRDGKQKSTLEYNKKSYASGRVGFIWGGGVASFIHRMEITGKIDGKKMAELIRNGSKK